MILASARVDVASAEETLTGGEKTAEGLTTGGEMMALVGVVSIASESGEYRLGRLPLL